MLTKTQVAELIAKLEVRSAEVAKKSESYCPEEMQRMCEARAAGINDAIYLIKLYVEAANKPKEANPLLRMPDTAVELGT
jgi:hypothetical protein